MIRISLPCVLLAALLLPPISPLTAQTGARNILLEEFSTAQCGFCPDGDVTAARIVEEHPSVIWVTHHAGFGVDSMTALHSPTIAGAFVNFAPSGVIDRVAYPKHVAPYENLGNIRSKWDSLIVAHLGDEQYAALHITSTYRAGSAQLECNVDIAFSTVPPAGDIRVNLFIVEDSIIGLGQGYDQKNYYNGTTGHKFYQAGDPIIGYAHHRVVSAIPTGTWGAAGIIPSTPTPGQIYSYTWSGDLRAIWDASNLGRHDIITLVAFVSYYSDDVKLRQVIHAAEAKITTVILDADTPPALPGGPVVAVWPNPATDRVAFAASPAVGRTGVLTVTDFTGRTVARYKVSSEHERIVLPVARFSNGMYFYRLSSGAQSAAGKFVVLH
jgi:hypothetical protein